MVEDVEVDEGFDGVDLSEEGVLSACNGDNGVSCGEGVGWVMFAVGLVSMSFWREIAAAIRLP